MASLTIRSTRSADTSGRRSTPRARRLVLLTAVLLAAAAAAVLAVPRPSLQADPELARLLRGMGILKGIIAAAALSLAWWRLGSPIAPTRLAGYVTGTAILAAAAVLVFQLAVIATTSVAFHTTLLALGFLALRDGRSALQLGPRRTNRSH